MEAAVGSSHPDVSEILYEYAGLLRRTGRKAESEQIARQARRIDAAFTQQTNADRSTVDWRDLK